MFLYGWLHLSGYAVSLDDVKAFRQLHSITPGHPEFGETDGVECTTGPLGQGVGNAVGLAVSQKMAAARYNTDAHTIFDNHVIALAGDGCLQEGVAREAVAFAGHQGLDNLILIYDANDVTLDAQADESQSEDTGSLYRALGWDVTEIDGHDMAAILTTVEAAKANDNARPKIIIAKTEVGRGIPEVAGTWKAHGEGGAKFAETARAGMGLPAETFFVSHEVQTYFADHKADLAKAYAAWEVVYGDWKAANPALAAELEASANGVRPSVEDLLEAIPAADPEKAVATRAAGGEVLQPLAEKVPTLLSGSADLYGSTKNYLKACTDFTKADRTGRNVRYGIREHAMGAIVNGIGYDGLFIAHGATFLTFSDYCRPSLRLAALAKLPIFHVFTHDSVGVGEDGPTHQPVETTSSLRLIPGMTVIRPADPEETAGAFAFAVSHEGPTSLILSRQGLPHMSDVPVDDRREGTLKGGYVLVRETGELKTILLASGSEVQHAVAAAKTLGDGVRVVSMPSFELFNAQEADYRESVLPSDCRQRVAIEAGVTGLWPQYVGLDGKVIGVDRFGLSAPGGTVMKELGMTAETVVAAVEAL